MACCIVYEVSMAFCIVKACMSHRMEASAKDLLSTTLPESKLKQARSQYSCTGRIATSRSLPC
eukprot:1279497-Rhodomonas_salina.2